MANQNIQPGTPQWESICIQCGLCCLLKYIDEQTGRVYLTNIRCDMLDPETGCCKCYSADVNERSTDVYNCIENGGISLNFETLRTEYAVPGCCAYVQMFGEPKLVKKCAKKPNIDLKDTVAESDVMADKRSEHVIQGTHKYFKYNPYLNDFYRKNCGRSSK